MTDTYDHSSTALAIVREAIDGNLDTAMTNLACRVGNKWTAKIRKSLEDVRHLHADANADKIAVSFYEVECLIKQMITFKLHSTNVVDMIERLSAHTVNSATYNSAEPLLDQLCDRQNDLADKVANGLREINLLTKSMRRELQNMRKNAQAAVDPKPAPQPTRIPKALADEATIMRMGRVGNLVSAARVTVAKPNNPIHAT